MNEEKKSPNVGWWGGQLDQIVEEIARLCAICNIRFLDPGVIPRIIKGDESVCGSPNKIAFKKLRDVLGIGYAVREKSSKYVGEDATLRSIQVIVERLQEKYGDRFGRPE
jgi:hypothetical protein